MRVRWTEQAVQNLQDIKEFVGKDSPSYAVAVVSRLYYAVSQLEQFPDSGRIVPERGDPAIRELVRSPYRIVYRRSATMVEVLLVFRSSLPLPHIT